MLCLLATVTPASTATVPMEGISASVCSHAYEDHGLTSSFSAHCTTWEPPVAFYQGAHEQSADAWASIAQSSYDSRRDAGNAHAVSDSADEPLRQEVIENVFVPVWASMLPRVGDDEPTASRLVAHARFVPVWASPHSNGQPPAKEPQQKPARPASKKPVVAAKKPVIATMRHSVERDKRRTASHPYLKPAYGESRLRSDQVTDAKALAERLVQDRTPGCINASAAQLEEMAMAVAEARADGINPRTASKDAFALREFEAFAVAYGFDPNLKSEWIRRFPERESLKLAAFLLWRAQRAVSRDRKGVAKPMSLYQNYLALRRVYRARNVELPPPTVVRETLRGLIRRFIRRFGIDALRPKRVEPVTPPMIQRCVDFAKATGSVIRGAVWNLSHWLCFIVTAWMVINLSVGSRKGESTKLTGDVDENDWFNRRALSWHIGGRTYVDPPLQLLSRLTEGDHARLAPRGSKCDQWGTMHGTEPIILPFHDTPLNAAKWLRDIELRWPAHGPTRDVLPLFPDENGKPFNDATFSALINAVLAAVLGKDRAKLLSPHSWRVWLASSLRMCGATDARIQAMGRWLNPDSIKIYARMTTQEYALWVDKLMAVKRIDTARTTSLPVMDAAAAIAQWHDQLHVNGMAHVTEWVAPAPVEVAPPALTKRGDRVSVYWTDMPGAPNEWFTGTCKATRVESADGGGQQRATCVAYDPVGVWKNCTPAQLTYWHCLDDEHWQFE